MSTHNICFEKKYDKYQRKFSVNGVKFSIYLNRHVCVMLHRRSEIANIFHDFHDLMQNILL